MKVLALLALFFLASEAYVAHRYIGKCELIRTMQQLGMDGFSGYPLGMWVCLAKYSSRMDTQYHFVEGSQAYYGLFRINALRWCDNGKIPSENLCGISCSKFLDYDIRDDIECVKKIVRSRWGIRTWWAYERFCKRESVHMYTRGCSNLYLHG